MAVTEVCVRLRLGPWWLVTGLRIAGWLRSRRLALWVLRFASVVTLTPAGRRGRSTNIGRDLVRQISDQTPDEASPTPPSASALPSDGTPPPRCGGSV